MFNKISKAKNQKFSIKFEYSHYSGIRAVSYQPDRVYAATIQFSLQSKNKRTLFTQGTSTAENMADRHSQSPPSIMRDDEALQRQDTVHRGKYTGNDGYDATFDWGK